MNDSIPILITIYAPSVDYLLKFALYIKLEDLHEDALLNFMQQEHKDFFKSLLPPLFKNEARIVNVEEICEIL